jgi:N utilization substance protein B
MSSRSKGRKRALDILYESDIRSLNPLWLIKERTTTEDQISLFAAEIVEGYGARAKEIDALIDKNAKNWDIDRLAHLDRNILRIATYEILEHKNRNLEIPIIIDEALELAKSLSTDDSPRYIHGILSAIAQADGAPPISQ